MSVRLSEQTVERLSVGLPTSVDHFPSTSASLYVGGGNLAVIDDASNNTYDALAYFKNYSSNDWCLKVAKSTYNYGIFVEGTGTQLLKVGTNETFRVDNTAVYVKGASINMSKAGETGIEVDNTQTTNPNKVAFIVGSSGNGGIYSRKHTKWIVYSDASGNVVLNGNANTATTAGYATTAARAVTAGYATTAARAVTAGYATTAARATTAGNATDATKVLKAGDTMTGTLTIKGIKGTSGTDYGATLPSAGSEGQLFFQTGAEFYELPTGGSTGQALIKNSATDRDVAWGSIGGVMQPTTTTKYYVSGSSVTSQNANPALFNTSIYVENSVLFGAAWNDYAEYRQTKKDIQPGRCVTETGKGDLILSTQRLQEGCEIVSDTFGFSIGESKDCKTPIAIAGRVLAYLYEDRQKARPGQPVCSGPDGTISLMSKEEARNYPWCIIGTISEIPDYDIWYAGSEKQIEIKVNKRVWIRIR